MQLLLIRCAFAVSVLINAPAFVFAQTIDFNRDVRPILADHCYQCHGPDEATRAAGLRLDLESSATADLGGYAAVVPGDAESSELVIRIQSDDPGLRMPPEEANKPLSKQQIATLQDWVASGAPFEKHWSFEPPTRPTPPEATASDWPNNPIDHFVLAKLEAAGMEPSPPAAKTKWLRRVTLDLTGLPPTLEEVDAFLADESPAAYRRVVDRLLQSERYGEAMALDWLDAARYADTDGYQNDGPREMWPWRDWVIEAYNANMPFDEFTIQQLAGDLLPNATLRQRIATGFNRNHRYNSEAGLVLEEFLLENAVDRVDTTSTVWMGLTIGCARCHDHKFDPVSQREYYQLVNFFNNITESGRAVKFGNSEPWVQAPTRRQQQRQAQLDERITANRRALAKAHAQIDAALQAFLADEEALHEPRLELPGRSHAFHFDNEETEKKDQPEQDQAEKEDSDAEDDGVTTVDGIIGPAKYFDGGGRLPLGKVGDARGEKRFSFSFWIKPDRNEAGGVDDGVLLSRQTPNTRRPGLAVELRDDKLVFFLITRWVAGVGAVETKHKVAPGEWTHVAITNDGSQSARGMRIYLNGQQAETRTLHNTNSNTGGTPKSAMLRAAGGVHGANYRGVLDELRYYARSLWPDEVELLSREPSLPEVLATPRDERTDVQAALARNWFLAHHAPPRLQKLAYALHNARIKRLQFRDALPTTMVMEERDEPRITHVRRRGVYDDLGEVVPRDTPDIFPPLPATGQQNRLTLAKWLVSGEHPLTARVTVNRYWQRYFGRGLVDTPGDFGLQGSLPSHPQLLDWLATEFVRSGWDVKYMQRLIVLSSAYRQSSEVSPRKLEEDPENRLYSRGPRLRLPAHTVRDQALAIGGLLSGRQGGPSVKTFQPAGLWAEMSNMRYKLGQGEDLYRRSLYTFWKRTVAPPSMTVLDAADRESCAVQFRRTNTPLQALTLLNETAFVQAAFGLAYKLIEDDNAGTDATTRETSPRQLVRRGFRTVTARWPSPKESRVLEKAFQDYLAFYRERPQQAAALIASAKAPLPLEQIEDKPKLAAATAFANVLLNLDEMISKE